jgi:hypothetical protein
LAGAALLVALLAEFVAPVAGAAALVAPAAGAVELVAGALAGAGFGIG